MNTVWFAVERLIELFSIFLHINFLYRIMDTKTSLKKQAAITSVFVLLRMLYYDFGLEFRPYFAVVSAVIYSNFIFAGKLETYVVWNVLAIVIDGIIDALVASVYLWLPNTSIGLIGVPGITRTIIAVIAKLLLFLSYSVAARKVDKNDEVNRWDCVLILLVTSGCWILLEMMFKYGKEISPGSARPMMAAGSLALLLIIISVVMLYNRIKADGRKLARSELQLHVLEITKAHISQVHTLYTQLSGLQHDLQNHFSAIAGYLNAQKYVALKEYIDNLVDIKMDIPYYISHPVLNILITSRLSLASEENIEFSPNLVLPEHLPVNDVDLCILISNILDNAFDAAKAVPGPKVIDFNAQIVNSYWVIACRNSVHKKGAFKSFCSIKTTKNTTGMHGIGTKQIKQIAEQTGGFVTYQHKGYEFFTLVMLRLREG
jgi:sensor histidine kinase YesM